MSSRSPNTPPLAGILTALLKSHLSACAFLFIVLLTGCSPATMIEQFANDEKEQIARTYIQRLIDGDLDALAAELEPQLRSGNEIAQLREMRSLLPAEPPAVTNLVGYYTHTSFNNHTDYNLTYQFGYASKWILVNAAWREFPSSAPQIIGMRAQPLAASLQEINALSFKNARTQHYVFIGSAMAIPLFIVTTLIVCARTPNLPRKWLWMIFILLGLTSSSLNWTTGEISFSPISLHLLGVSAFAASIYSPWIVSVSLPVGALAFWFKRRSLVSPPPPPPPTPLAAS